MNVTHPPVIDAKNPSVKSIEKWITPWPTISFEKINYPKYEGIHQYLGEPSNQPDFIKDYHVISLARNIDYWSKPLYDARINCDANAPTSN